MRNVSAFLLHDELFNLIPVMKHSNGKVVADWKI